jgi:hypothetical protein
MHFSVRALDPTGKFLPQLKLELLAQVFPRDAVQAVLREVGCVTPRQRKLNLEVILWLVIGMNLYAQAPLQAVLDHLTHGLRLLWPDDTERQQLLPRKHAITYRRYQLGVRPVRALFHRFCRPLATPATRGAFLHDLRLVAIDSHTEEVPDTPENAAAFGRHYSDRGPSAFPEVLCVTLCECGTHALLDATFWPRHTGEGKGARRLLRSVTPEMLVLGDRGLHDYALLAAVRERGAHVLERLSKTPLPKKVKRLPDGSFLAELWPTSRQGRPQGEHLLVRIIEYTLNDPQLPGHGQRYRLLTTLLDPERYPAHTLICTYHERWEIELTIDELDTHQLQQRRPASPLRSRKPRGVMQERYGLLLAHYAVRSLMHQAAVQIDEAPDRLSFTHALQVLQTSVADFEIAAPELIPGLCRRLLRDRTQPLLPEREPRSEPRVVRRKIIRWPLKRLEHYRWPQPTRPFWAAVTLTDWGGAALI